MTTSVPGTDSTDRTERDPHGTHTAGADRGRSDETPPESSFRLLAVTSFRPAEVENSTAFMDADTRVVTIDDSLGAVGRVKSAAVETDRAIREHHPDVLLLDTYGTIGAPVAAVAARHGVPVVARLKSDIWRRMEDEHLRRTRENRDVVGYALERTSAALTRFALRRARGFVVVSNALQEVVTRRTGTPPERIGVVPVPVTRPAEVTGDADRARDRYNIDAQRVLLTVTNLSYQDKCVGVRDSIRELEPLLRENPDVAYVVAGDGRYLDDLRDALHETIPEESVRDRVHLLGFVDAVEDLYALADVFLYVSYLDGYPNAVLEAQTAGLPVVANAAHGMLDQVEDGENGFLVDTDTPGDVRRSVETLLENSARARRFGRAGADRVRRQNQPADVSRQLERFLETMTERST